MNNYDLLILFTVMFAATITPGPAMLYAMDCGVRYRFRDTVLAATAISIMAVSYGALALLGLAAAMMQMGELFTVLKIMGGLYLLYCGWQRFSAPYTEMGESQSAKANKSPLGLFVEALLLGASNPKGILFFAALFPQFIPQNAGPSSMLPILIITFATSFLGLMLYSVGGKLMTGALKIRSIQKVFNVFAGCFYCWFGFGLITDGK